MAQEFVWSSFGPRCVQADIFCKAASKVPLRAGPSGFGTNIPSHRLMGRLDDLVEAHARLKRRIHGFRYPIHSRAGRFAIGCVYFFTPVILGILTMKATNAIADRNLGAEGKREKLLAARQSWGGKRAVAAPPPPAST